MAGRRELESVRRVNEFIGQVNELAIEHEIELGIVQTYFRDARYDVNFFVDGIESQDIEDVTVTPDHITPNIQGVI